MRDREKAPRPSRTKVEGAEKPKPKSSSRSQPTKSSSSKSSSSGLSKSSTSSTRKPAGTSSSSKSSTGTKPRSSSRPPKAAASTSSSDPRSLELKPEKVPSSSSKPVASRSRDERSKSTSSKNSSEAKGSQESRRSDRRSGSKSDKSQDVGSRQPGRGDRSSSKRTEKDSSTSRSKKPPSQSKVDKSESGRKPPREDRASKSRGKSRDRDREPRSEKSESISSNRRLVSKEKSSRSSNDSKNSKSSERSSSKKSSLDKKENVKDKSRSSTKKEEKEKTKEERSDLKSSQSRAKSAKRSSSRKEEPLIEEKDMGIEGIGIQDSVTEPESKGQQEAEVVDQNQNDSLETMESGISVSTPQDLSGDEAEVEESISSKMVEVDEVAEEGLQDEDDEAMIDYNASQEASMDDTFPSDLQYQNLPASLVSHSDIPESNDVERTEDLKETKEHPANDDEVVAANDNGDEEPEYDDYYEDEFEDYESDFEDDTGSGNEDSESSSLSTSSSSALSSSSSSEESDVAAKDPDLAAVLQAMEKENNFASPLERIYTFDDPTQDKRPESSEVQEKQGVVQETASKAEPQEKQNTTTQRPKTSRTFVNFAVAKRKQEAAHIHSKMNSRGRNLLSMIHLDTVSVDLLTLAPVSYEAYISSFGHSNRQQVSVQTNEDALSEEIQTDPIVMRNKWTQKPVHISIGKDSELPGPEDYMGVGGDVDPLTFSGQTTGKSSTTRLTSFLTSASQVMLALLEEELIWETAESNKNDSAATSEGLGFSQPPVSLGQNVQSLLEGRTTPFVTFCPSEPNMLLSGHGFHSLGEENIEEFQDGGLLCVWWVQEPSRPQHLLSSCSTPTAATFSPARPSLIIAGLEDGSLATWDLRESLQLHTLKINIGEDNWRVRVPSYITACDESGGGEGSAIKAIHTVTTEEDQLSDTHGSFQVVTLTANGLVTWWVVMHVPLTNAIGDFNFGRKSATVRTISNHVAVSPHLGASPWARVAINRAATINVANTLYGDEAISDEILCHDLKMDINDPSQLYVATGSGAVAHCSRHSSRIHPKAYYPEFEPGCESLCIALCPHDYRYLLVGSSDGMVRLHSISSERPLTTWQSAPDCSPIKGLQWSPARPCVFYVLDAMARLHVWDLSAGDIFPMLTVEAGGLVGGALCSFSIAPTQPTSHHPLYAVFASDGGEMVLRQVGHEFSTHQLQDDYDTELERFTYYVNII